MKNLFTMPSPIEEMIGKPQSVLIEMTKRSVPQKIGFAIVDALEISNIDNPTQNPTPLLTTSIQHSPPPPTMEMATITSSDLTPPPTAYTPTSQQVSTKKQTQSSDNSKKGPAKRLQYDTKDNLHENQQTKTFNNISNHLESLDTTMASPSNLLNNQIGNQNEATEKQKREIDRLYQELNTAHDFIRAATQNDDIATEVIEKGYENQFTMPSPIEEMIGKPQSLLIEMTKRPVPQKIGFAIVDALEISNLDNPTQNPTPLLTTSIQHTTPPPAMEMATITSSYLTPPPTTYTPTSQQEATKKQTQSSDNSKRGPAKRLQYDTKAPEKKKKKQSDSQNEDEA
ncbi:hypothetical protein L1887_23917 [Cichorium endivia]|nr:hypothetical protein L1887_23917 [Cichorium endivia]